MCTRCAMGLLAVLILTACGDDSATPSRGDAGDGHDAAEALPANGDATAGKSGSTGTGGAGGANGSGGTAGGGGFDAGDADASTEAGDAGLGDASDAAAACVIEGAAPGTNYFSRFQSGTRIKAQYLSADGMPDTFVGFFDASLGVECDFLRATDGELRCLPRDAMGTLNRGYADAQCTRRLLDTVAACATENGYVRRVDACRERYEVRKLERLSVTTPRYQTLNEECVDSGETIDPNDVTFVAGDPIAPSEFVAGTVRTLPGSCRAGLRVVETDDGASGPLEVVDLGFELACRPSSPGASSCAPSNRAYLDPTLFRDADCTEPASFGTWSLGPECDPPDVIDARGTDFDFHRVAGIFEGTAYANPACEPAREKAWIGTIFEPGEGLNHADLAQFESVAEGSGRLRAYQMSEGSVALMAGVAGLQIGSFYDSELDEDCTVFPFVDGVYRCVPTRSVGGLGGPEYNDAACTEPVVICEGDDCPGQLFVSREIEAGQCATYAVVDGVWRARNERGEGTYADNAGICQEIAVSGAGPWLADSVEFDTLARVDFGIAD